MSVSDIHRVDLKLGSDTSTSRKLDLSPEVTERVFSLKIPTVPKDTPGPDRSVRLPGSCLVCQSTSLHGFGRRTTSGISNRRV